METDYRPGDDPLPLETVVEYVDRPGCLFRVLDHGDPMDHPLYGRKAPEAMRLGDALRVVYPDGVTYHLWPVGVPVKLDNRGHSVSWVRRRSIRVHREEKG